MEKGAKLMLAVSRREKKLAHYYGEIFNNVEAVVIKSSI